MTRRAAVLGSPVAHSLSPALHRAAYDQLGLADWSYTAQEVDEDGLAGFLDRLDRDWAGLSLTMPLKAAVLPLLDAASPVVEMAGGANTVLLRDGRRVGENTDVPGMVAALVAAGVGLVGEVTLLGGGATARSAVVALAGLTRTVRAYVRDPSRRAGLEAAAAASGVGLEVEPWSRAVDGLSAPLVVSTAATGATDHLVGSVPREVGALFDVLYDPWPTPLAAAWAARSGTVVDGLDLLVHQGVLQVLLMTGSEAAPADLVPVLRAAGERALRS
ncbi:MAG: shikimate dehydrogenase [Sporichthyaceae bacterium]